MRTNNEATAHIQICYIPIQPCLHSLQTRSEGERETKQVLAQKERTPIKERVLHNATQPVGIFLTAAARHTVGAGVIRV